MSVLIDSNIIIAFLKGEQKVESQIRHLIQQNVPLCIATVSIYEVYLGIIANLYLKQGRPNLVPELLQIYNQFVQTCSILDFTQSAAEKAADIYAQSQGKGMSIKQNDCMIAGIALHWGISQVLTQDSSDFERIKQLTGLEFKAF